MPISSFAFPTIYFLHPHLIESRSVLDAILDRCRDMGFSHVMARPQVVKQADAARLPSPARGMVEEARQESARPVGLEEIVECCAERSLRLILVLDILDVSVESLPGHLVHPNAGTDEPPDPRQPIGSRKPQALNFTSPQAIATVLDYWTEKVGRWLETGVAGFCCQGLGEMPASFWRALIQRGRATSAEVGWMAWTPGCPAEKVLELAGAGFDVTFSSAAWWNYRSEWLTEEHARLRQVGAPVAFPESPFFPSVHCFDEAVDEATRRRAYQRALWMAAAAGNGLLVPMGFEFGMAEGCRGSQAKSIASGFFGDQAVFDLSTDIADACRFVQQLSSVSGDPNEGLLEFLGTGGEHAVALLRRPEASNGPNPAAFVIAANQSLHAEAELDLNRFGERMHGFLPVASMDVSGTALPRMDGRMEAGRVHLPPGALAIVEARRPAPVLLANVRGKRAIDAALRVPRVAIENPGPAVDGGRFPVKRIVGELVDVEADVFMDGHDKLGVALLWRPADEADWREVRMQPLGNDRWRAVLPLARLGRHLLVVEAWRDAFATYRDELEKKAKAGLDVRLELEEGRLLVAGSAAHAEAQGLSDVAQTLAGLARLLAGVLDKRGRKIDIDPTERIAALLSERTLQAMRQADPRHFAVRSESVLAIDAERPAARFSSWYELFPRSQSGDPERHGTFADVEKRLPAIRDMGFDTLYFTPIHPIGKRNRKGRNNSLTAAKDDPGSPYAIGSEEGGHDAIHPQLGTLEDFRRLRDAAARHGLELALDFAIQCSPDHPWLKEHPEWFAWRPDGSLRYAENPPKKYEDIVNVDFYAEGAMPSLWVALRDAVLFWVKEGVRVFRVDNPHTKPLPFWQWMIADIRSRYPDTIFLSEAFTRPKVMYRLAKVGFSQSYTYFTWRNTKAEFIDYLTELTTTPVREFFRPHFFVNTPDINPVFLQHSGRPGFLIRAALATTLSGLWGMYSGFELCEATPVPGKEEYLDSEKYEIRAWDWERPGNIIQEISVLNRIRKTNPALQTHLGIRFLPASDDHILFFVKATAHPSHSDRFGDNVILVAINLDPFSTHEAQLEIPLWRFGMPDDGALDAEDLINGNRFHLRGKMQQIRLDPFSQPYAIWRVQPEGGMP